MSFSNLMFAAALMVVATLVYGVCARLYWKQIQPRTTEHVGMPVAEFMEYTAAGVLLMAGVFIAENALAQFALFAAFLGMSFMVVYLTRLANADADLCLAY